jgi:hypothetical protein
VFRRDNFTCVYCGRGSPDVTLHCDHKLAHSKGGSDDKENLVTACQDCNFGKGAKNVIRPTPALPRNTNETGLVGLFGHTRNDDGSINWQFEIVGKINDDAYTVQLFSWLDGRPTDVKIFTTLQITSHSLYSTREAWINQWAKEREYTYGEAA